MNFQKKLAKRKNLFKSKGTQRQASKKREDLMIKISKQKKEELLSKKRNISQFLNENYEDKEHLQELINNLPEITSKLINSNYEDPLPLVQNLRTIVSTEDEPPMDEIIFSGVIPYIMNFMKDDSNNLLQYESAWIISNIASGTSLHTEYVVNNEAISEFCHLLSSKDKKIQDQAIWGLGNIAGESAEYRDQILSLKVFPKIISLLKNEQSTLFLQNSIWTLSIFVKQQPSPIFDEVKDAFPIFYDLLQHKDQEICSSALWGLSWFSTGELENIQTIIELGIVPIIIEQLKNNNNKVYIPCIKILGNISSGTDLQTQVVIDNGFLPILKDFLKDENPILRREACWALSNLGAGTTEQLGQLFKQNIIHQLVKILKTDLWSIKKECCIAVTNIIEGATTEQIDFLISNGILYPLCTVLEFKDEYILNVTLSALYTILKHGNQAKLMKENKGFLAANQYAVYIERAEGKTKIEKLINHKNRTISEYSENILKKFFKEEIEDYIEF
ncbi:importin subunit alpha-4 [Anaeramoeba flamelloides]|uniref:Importin subunit alpha n=1 Tax=Anaeramoeba flamelloides TaxID=1746091 RepID=A0AAV7ZEA0_9EUKA|nr:importin subunit alpha-4 [Anaeramoeba flamelloides]